LHNLKLLGLSVRKIAGAKMIKTYIGYVICAKDTMLVEPHLYLTIFQDRICFGLSKEKLIFTSRKLAYNQLKRMKASNNWQMLSDYKVVRMFKWV
jgi:hypothetical protein